MANARRLSRIFARRRLPRLYAITIGPPDENDFPIVERPHGRQTPVDVFVNVFRLRDVSTVFGGGSAKQAGREGGLPCDLGASGFRDFAKSRSRGEVKIYNTLVSLLARSVCRKEGRLSEGVSFRGWEAIFALVSTNSLRIRECNSRESRASGFLPVLRIFFSFPSTRRVSYTRETSRYRVVSETAKSGGYGSLHFARATIRTRVIDCI